MQPFTLQWQGWAEHSRLPAVPGIYCVWTAPVTRDQYGSPTITNTAARLVYIGQARDIATRIANHERWADWRRQQRSAIDTIVFTYAPFDFAGGDDSWRLSVENCLIATHRPPCNVDDLTYHYQLSVVIQNVGVTFGQLQSAHKCKGSADPQDP